jgi:hypothetical protein
MKGIHGFATLTPAPESPASACCAACRALLFVERLPCAVYRLIRAAQTAWRRSCGQNKPYSSCSRRDPGCMPVPLGFDKVHVCRSRDLANVAVCGRAFAAMWHHSGIEPQLPISVLRTESRHNLVLLTNLNKLARRDINNRRTVLVEIWRLFPQSCARGPDPQLQAQVDISLCHPFTPLIGPHHARHLRQPQSHQTANLRARLSARGCARRPRG